MNLKESGEMYLETIYVLSQKSGFVRSIDVCEEMGYSKPSVSRAVSLLKEGGYLTVSHEGSLILTELGKEIAEKTYERHTVLSKLFVNLGVSEDVAAADACKIEHVISDETFNALKEHLLLNTSK
jgi:Mn-dependent DtxR family transcriptional regulator